jgi:hypothetical protein
MESFVSKRAPKIGDKVEHTCTLNGRFEGVVIEVLSTQFIYKTAEGHERFCLFKEIWKKLDES